MLEKIEGRIVNDIDIVSSEMQENLYEKVFIYFDEIILKIEVDNSTDELLLSLKEEKTGISKKIKQNQWNDKFIGRQVISYWLCKNNKGYFDCLCIGLDEFIPSIVITSIISHIEIRVTV